MESKCPCCGGRLSDDVDGVIVCWNKCSFRCDTKDLPRISAAMELARVEFKLNRCDPKYEHQWQFHVCEARKLVLEVFGGE